MQRCCPRIFVCAALALALAVLPVPALAQTQVWSQAPKTQRWSDPPPTPPAPAQPQQPAPRTAVPQQPQPYTSQWAAPVHTQRRSEADIQRQIDAISHNAERDARAGRGAGLNRSPASQVPDQVWRNHMDRTRAQEQWQREQDAYHERQRQYNRR